MKNSCASSWLFTRITYEPFFNFSYGPHTITPQKTPHCIKK